MVKKAVDCPKESEKNKGNKKEKSLVFVILFHFK